MVKVIAILPAYNCGNSLEQFAAHFPIEKFASVILVDDCSTDGTYKIAQGIKWLKVYRTPRNLGYGGNVKFCLNKALEVGAEVIVEIHPDGEYAFDGIDVGVVSAQNGAGMVLGNRFAKLTAPLKNGMYWWKYPALLLLNLIDNLVLGTKIPDLHQGFRIYTRGLLEKTKFRELSDDYNFSFEIIVRAIRRGVKIASVPVSCRYSGIKRGASLRASIKYAMATFSILRSTK